MEKISSLAVMGFTPAIISLLEEHKKFFEEMAEVDKENPELLYYSALKIYVITEYDRNLRTYLEQSVIQEIQRVLLEYLQIEWIVTSAIQKVREWEKRIRIIVGEGVDKNHAKVFEKMLNTHQARVLSQKEIHQEVWGYVRCVIVNCCNGHGQIITNKNELLDETMKDINTHYEPLEGFVFEKEHAQILQAFVEGMVLFRNKKVMITYCEGETYSSLAKSFGISVTRVDEIIKIALRNMWKDFVMEYRYFKDENKKIKLKKILGVDVGDDSKLFVQIADIRVSVRTTNILLDAGYYILGALAVKKEDDVSRIKNCGRKTLKEIKEVMSKHGLTFGMTLNISQRRLIVDANKLTSGEVV